MSSSQPTTLSAHNSLGDVQDTVRGQIHLRCLTTFPNHDASSSAPSPLVLSGILTLSAVQTPVNQSTRPVDSFLGLSNVDLPKQLDSFYLEPILNSSPREDGFDSNADSDATGSHDTISFRMSRFLPSRELPEDSPAIVITSFEERVCEEGSFIGLANPNPNLKRGYDDSESSGASTRRPRIEVSSDSETR